MPIQDMLRYKPRKNISHLTGVNSSSNSSKTIVPRKIIEGLNLRTSVKQPKMGDVVIATYKLSYKKGMVIALGIYSDDIITNVNLTNTSVKQPKMGDVV